MLSADIKSNTIQHEQMKGQAQNFIAQLCYCLTLLQNMCAFTKARCACEDFFRLVMSRRKIIKVRPA